MFEINSDLENEVRSLKKEIVRLKEEKADLGDRIIQRDIVIKDLIATGNKILNMPLNAPLSRLDFKIALDFAREAIK